MGRCPREISRASSSLGKLNARFLPQISAIGRAMKPVLAKAGLILLALSVSATAAAQATLEGHWANPRHSVVVHVTRCGSAYCGVVSWATAKNRERGTTPGTRVLSD